MTTLTNRSSTAATGISGHLALTPSSPFSRLLKNGHLLRFPQPSSLRRTAEYASLLRISGALRMAIFGQPGEDRFFRILLE